MKKYKNVRNVIKITWAPFCLMTLYLLQQLWKTWRKKKKKSLHLFLKKSKRCFLTFSNEVNWEKQRNILLFKVSNRSFRNFLKQGQKQRNENFIEHEKYHPEKFQSYSINPWHLLNCEAKFEDKISTIDQFWSLSLIYLIFKISIRNIVFFNLSDFVVMIHNKRFRYSLIYIKHYFFLDEGPLSMFHGDGLILLTTL